MIDCSITSMKITPPLVLTVKLRNSFSIIYLLMHLVETKNVAAVTNYQGNLANNQLKF